MCVCGGGGGHGGEGEVVGALWSPCTLCYCPTPCVLHPRPLAAHLPYTLHPAPCTLHPRPRAPPLTYTLNPGLLAPPPPPPLQAAFLRSVVAREVSGDPEFYSAAFLGMTNVAYCNWILNPINWGGGIELSILSRCSLRSDWHTTWYLKILLEMIVIIRYIIIITRLYRWLTRIE